MKLTTKGHYAVKALLDLSLQPNFKPTSVRAIALRQDIPAPYLEKILIKIRQAGLINSVRGAQGGYQLAYQTDQISLGQILEAVGENLESMPLDINSQNNSADWVTVALWRKLNQKIKQAIYSITLADLYYDARSRQASQGEENNFIV
ncbi:RrF2 family transcriptional regulator [Cyanobacterium stanieri LEGE 03274]|uniref:RrF2 family transcriptional regulator n=1 Tax=Cyanobacterium stanieri LEGE 03274 TaxID=1828756 RepID=A0ABR9V7M2_9CHRO|nr:RrF2 family transcriptional regulator [Cyanobacterium stanieri]MBE9222814.1 RrF2 family transcriptional regulator [Cyanobacterium stanieri LEGE 03274]